MRALIIGIILFIISFSIGIGAMYYEAPKLMLDEEFSLEREAITSFPIEETPLKVYYNITCESEGALKISMGFLSGEGGSLGNLTFSGNKKISSSGYEYLPEESREVRLTLTEGDHATCCLKLYYSQFDEMTLLLMVSTQIVTSMLAISLILSYYLKLRRERTAGGP
jgi:hypothetical protein